MARFPGPWMAKLTKWWLRWHEIRGRRDQAIENLHKTYGRLVQIGPNQVSVNDHAGLRDIFAINRKLDRANPLYMLHNYGSENLVSTVDGELHQQRRKPLRTLYSTRAVESPEKHAIFSQSLDSRVDYINGETRQRRLVEVSSTFRWLGADIVSHFTFGSAQSLNLLGDEKARLTLKSDLQSFDERLLSLSTLIMLYYPRLLPLLKRILGFLPRWFDRSPPETSILTQNIRSAMSKFREHPTSRDHTSEGHVQRLTANFDEQGRSAASPGMDYVMSDTLDHFSAGVTTTADALSAAVFHLSHPHNTYRQDRLREELARSGITSNLTPSFDQAKQSEYLECIIQETLRRNPPISDSIERRIPPNSQIEVHGQTLPSGMEVSAQPYSVHRNEAAFSNAESWNPERWDIPHKSETYVQMKRHFFAFGAGSRMCIGMNIARTQLRLTLARIYTTYRTSLGPEWFDKTGAVIDFDRKKSPIPSRSNFPIKFERLAT